MANNEKFTIYNKKLYPPQKKSTDASECRAEIRVLSK
jgi:hypothetical protein